MNETIKQRIDAVRCGEIPNGYATERAMLYPLDWGEPTALNAVLTENKDRNEDLVYGVEDVLSVSGEQGVVNQIELLGRSYAGESVAPYHIVETGDVVYTKSPLKNNPYGIVKQNRGKPGIVSTLYAVYHCDSPITGQYLENYFCIDTFLNNYLKPLVKRGAKNDMKVNNEEVLLGRIPLPSLQEQECINEIIAQFDHIIEFKQQLLAEKRKQKQWLMQMLLDPDSGVRLPGFEDEWSTRTFNDICVFINGRAYKQDELLEVGKYPVLRVGNLFTKSEWYYSDMELPPHMYIDNGDLIYAWSASFGPRIWQGNKVIFHYHIWKVMPSEAVCKEYLYQYFQYDVDLLNREQQGGTMAHITKETMEKRLCRYPTLPEQKRISEILNAADRDIALTEQELEVWQQKKKALMQLLLTGLVHVNA